MASALVSGDVCNKWLGVWLRPTGLSVSWFWDQKSEICFLGLYLLWRLQGEHVSLHQPLGPASLTHGPGAPPSAHGPGAPPSAYGPGAPPSESWSLDPPLLLFLFFFFKKIHYFSFFKLIYSWFTMLCSFQVYSKVCVILSWCKRNCSFGLWILKHYN